MEIALAGAGIVPQASSDVEMVALWLNQYRSDQRTRNTSQAYATDVRLFMAFAAKSLAAVTVRDLQDFAASLGGLAYASQSRRLSAVKSLIGFAHRVGYLPFDVGAPIRLPAIKDALAERILAEDAVQRLLWTAEGPQRYGHGRYAKRNAALLRLLYGAGLRISEACALCWRDLTERDDAGQITVFGKGGKTRVILLPKSLWSRLDDLRGSAPLPDGPVFRSRNGGALSRVQVHMIVKAAVKRAKLPATVSAHFLRHSHASHALDRGAPVHVVQTTLGHASLATTTRYTHARPGDSSARYLPS